MGILVRKKKVGKSDACRSCSHLRTCWQHSAVAEVPHVSQPDVGAFHQPLAQLVVPHRGCLTEGGPHPTPHCSPLPLPLPDFRLLLVPGNKLQLGYVKKKKGLFSFTKWGCKNISCIQVQKITTALGLLNLGQKSVGTQKFLCPSSKAGSWFRWRSSMPTCV